MPYIRVEFYMSGGTNRCSTAVEVPDVEAFRPTLYLLECMGKMLGVNMQMLMPVIEETRKPKIMVTCDNHKETHEYQPGACSSLLRIVEGTA